MEEKKVILEAMKKDGEPLNAGKVAELTGLDRKIVDKAFINKRKEWFTQVFPVNENESYKANIELINKTFDEVLG